MSEATLTATEAVIDANAEAAKAAARAEEVHREESGAVSVEVESAIVAAVEHEEEEEKQEWLHVQVELQELRSQITQLREIVTEQSKNLSSQLLASMTEVFKTSLESLKTRSTPIVQSNPPETPVVSVGEIQAPAEVPEPEEHPKRSRTRKI